VQPAAAQENHGSDSEADIKFSDVDAIQYPEEQPNTILSQKLNSSPGFGLPINQPNFIKNQSPENLINPIKKLIKQPKIIDIFNKFVENEIFKKIIPFLNMDDLISLQKINPVFRSPLFRKEIKSQVRSLIFIVFFYRLYYLKNRV